MPACSAPRKPPSPCLLPLLPSSPPPPRSYAFSVWFPLAVQLRKELGELLVALGLVGAALQLFEALELWDNLIVCYQLLDKRVQVRVCARRWGALVADSCTGLLWQSVGTRGTRTAPHSTPRGRAVSLAKEPAALPNVCAVHLPNRIHVHLACAPLLHPS